MFENQVDEYKTNIIQIETDEQERIYGLRKGELYQVDTAFNLAQFFYENNIDTLCLERSVNRYKVLNLPFMLKFIQETIRPEEYLLNGFPLFAHFKKLSKSSRKAAWMFNYSYNRFEKDIYEFLENT